MSDVVQGNADEIVEASQGRKAMGMGMSGPTLSMGHVKTCNDMSAESDLILCSQKQMAWLAGLAW